MWLWGLRNRDTIPLTLSIDISAAQHKGERSFARVTLKALSCLQDSIEGYGLLWLKWSRQFCKSTSLQAVYKKEVPQFAFKTCQLSGKILQCLKGSAGRHFLVSACKRKRVKITQTNCSGYSETHERLQGVTRASQTPAQETLRSRNDTASSADRGICGKDLHCSQKPVTCQAGLKPSTLLGCSFDAEKPQSRKKSSKCGWGATACPPQDFFTLNEGWGFHRRLNL